MSKKLFLMSLTMAVALPVIVAPVQAQEVKTEVSQDFKDVSKNHSAYTEIMTMRDQGIINGYEDKTFRPTQAISRLHTAALFVRSLDLSPVRMGKEFKDVPKSNPYYNDVQTVYRAGIFDGNSDGTFGVNDNLTRAEMAKVLVNAFGLDIQKGYIFKDVYENNWAKDYITTLYMHGITVGDGNGKFNPNAAVSRADYSVFLYRALNPDKAPKPEKPLQPKPPAPGKPTPPKPPVEKPGGGSTTNPEPSNEHNPFPSTESVKIPVGWTTDKLKEHDAKAIDTVFKNAPKVGSGMSFGISKINIASFNDPVYLSNLGKGLEVIESSMTVQEWVDAANQVIKSGDIYIAPDYSFALYASYGSYMGEKYVKIHFAH
ncbi:S-layer homology domain-containing protein [Lysinibacillus sp. NPDC097231]|uniref:S-layer homology domain-containing protein n=1 Tax=Lysinibacillus sp. NPDC097231 TaxID=3364142 RepID=UPI0038197E37